MATTLFSSLFRRAPQVPVYPPKFPYAIKNNPYRCKRLWPPDFTQLSQKHQFRLERRYRRRTKLKWARPNWTKGVKLAQWGSILFVAVYGVLYLEVDDEKILGERGVNGGRGRTVFDGVRGWWKRQVGGLEGVEEQGVGGEDDASPRRNEAHGG